MKSFQIKWNWNLAVGASELGASHAQLQDVTYVDLSSPWSLVWFCRLAEIVYIDVEVWTAEEWGGLR